MTSNYTEKFLSEVALISSGKRPPEVCKDRNTDAQVPVIGGGGPSGFTAHPLTLEPTLITGRVGTLGKLHVSTGPAWPSDNALVIRPRSGIVSFDYLRYALTAVIHQAIGMNRGAANPLVTQSDLGKLLIPVPSSSVQARISLILRSLDDQIEILRENNATLEAIAQAIFKSWFIDFDPVKAKSEGRTPDGIDADTAALFPDSFEESALGAIPKGWRAGKFGDLARLAKGTINPLKEPDREFDHYSLPAFDNGARPVQERGGLIKSNKTPFFPGAVLQSKLNPHIPRVWFAPGVSESAVCSTEFLPWVATQGSCNELIYCLLCSDEFSRQVQTLVNGTSNSHQRIKPDLVAGMSVVISDNAVVRAFEEVAAPLMEQVKANIEEAATLAELRDTLLPRLISGKLKLPELQEVAEAL